MQLVGDLQEGEPGLLPLKGLLECGVNRNVMVFGSNNVVQVIEEWLEGAVKSSFRWNEREHPAYQVQIDAKVRGQKVVVFVDYDADRDFLGMYAYVFGIVPKRACAKVCEVLNELNYTHRYGSGELDREHGSVRARITMDVEGMRITSDVLAFMLSSLVMYWESGMMRILAIVGMAEECASGDLLLSESEG